MNKRVLVVFPVIGMVLGGIVFLGKNVSAPGGKEVLTTDVNVQTTSENKVSRHEQYMTDHAEKLAQLSTNPAFVGEDVDTQPAQAPVSTVKMIDGFKVKVPEVSEAQIEANIYKEQLSYTLSNMSPALLDGMMEEYKHEYATLLSEMGLQKDCTGAHCGYRIDDGAFLEALKRQGFESGDVILALNNTNVQNIADYTTFKKVMLNHANQLEFSIARKGEVKVLQVRVHEPTVEVTQGGA